MKANKIVAGMLVLLGFGGAIGLGSSCAHRASKSSAPVSVADSVSMPDVRVMYGVQPARFDSGKPIPKRADIPTSPETPAGE